MEQNNFCCLLLFIVSTLSQSFVVGAEKKRLNEMVLTFFVLIYLSIYLSIYSHSCIVVHIFFIHVQVVHMLLSTFAMLKSWPYICC